VVSWRNIAITLIDNQKGETKAQACANACSRQLAKGYSDQLQNDPSLFPTMD
jgi:hypothetical protein